MNVIVKDMLLFLGLLLSTFSTFVWAMEKKQKLISITSFIALFIFFGFIVGYAIELLF